MYFSRLQLRPEAARQLALRDMIGNAYHSHQALWHLFPGEAEQQRDFIFYLDEAAFPPKLFVLSKRKPEDRQNMWQMESKVYNPDLRSGDQLGFLLRANPVVRQNGKRHDVVMAEKHRLKTQVAPDKMPAQSVLVQQTGEAWLMARQARLGVKWLGVQVEGYQTRHLKKDRSRAQIQLSTLDFSGLLRVVDPDLLKEALFAGIGPAKGFGCGLLMLRRV